MAFNTRPNQNTYSSHRWHLAIQECVERNLIIVWLVVHVDWIVYLNQESGDMHFGYGFVNSNAVEAGSLYLEKFPDTRVIMELLNLLPATEEDQGLRCQRKKIIY